MQNGQKIKNELTPDSGEHGIKFLLAETECEFMIDKKAHSWGNKKLFENFTKCFKGQITTIQEEILADKYLNEDTLTTHKLTSQEDFWTPFILDC